MLHHRYGVHVWKKDMIISISQDLPHHLVVHVFDQISYLSHLPPMHAATALCLKLISSLEEIGDDLSSVRRELYHSPSDIVPSKEDTASWIEGDPFGDNSIINTSNIFNFGGIFTF